MNWIAAESTQMKLTLMHKLCWYAAIYVTSNLIGSGCSV